MNNHLNKKVILTALSIIIFYSSFSFGQTVNDKAQLTNDSLSLETVIQKVISSYPSVKVAEEAIRNAESRIGLARTGYNPLVDLTASFSNLAPVTKLSFPGLGTFQLYPGSNYAASVNYQQLIYDFGRTHQNIELENENKAISEKTLEQVKQKLSLYTINSFYTILFLQAAIKIKDEQLTTLNEHLEYIEKVMATGSATEYQVLTTKVKISSVESQKVDLIAALTTQQAILNSLLGIDQSNKPVVRYELTT